MKMLARRPFFQCRKILVRFVHLFLVLFVSGNLFIKKTGKCWVYQILVDFVFKSNVLLKELHDALVSSRYLYVSMYVLCVYSSIFFYFLTCFSDPGYVQVSSVCSFKGSKIILDFFSRRTSLRQIPITV